MTGEQAREAAAEFRDGARLVRDRSLALRGQHLVWWEGPAAEEYARRVRDRVAGLELAAAELETVAVLLDAVAALVRCTGPPAGPGHLGWALPA